MFTAGEYSVPSSGASGCRFWVSADGSHARDAARADVREGVVAEHGN